MKNYKLSIMVMDYKNKKAIEITTTVSPDKGYLLSLIKTEKVRDNESAVLMVEEAEGVHKVIMTKGAPLLKGMQLVGEFKQDFSIISPAAA